MHRMLLVATATFVLGTPVLPERSSADQDRARSMATSLGPVQDGSTRILGRIAGLDVEDVPLEEALFRLKENAGISVAYSPSLLPDGVRVTCRCESVTVGEAVSRILDGTSLRHSIGGAHLIIRESQDARLPVVLTGASVPSLQPVRLQRVGSTSVAPRLPPPVRTGSITGTVIDEGSRAPLAAVQVDIPGHGIGTTTNAAGRFSMSNVPSGEVVLRASRIGHATAERAVTVVSGQTVTVAFELSQTRVVLAGMVVSVETGAMSRMEAGTDIGRVDVERAVARGAASSVSQVLQARAPGISVTAGSGQAGAGSRVRIRGPSTLTQDNDPLLIIDGVRASNNTTVGTSAVAGGGTSRLNDLSPHEIEDIQIIKGPAATALYGSEAAPGVIVVRTKRGTTGEPSFDLWTRFGFVSNPWGYPDNYANVTEFYGVTDLNDPRLSQFRAEQHPLTGEIFLTHNPFMNPGTRPFADRSPLRGIGGSVSGGTEGVRYFVSAEDYREDGLVPANDYSRSNARGNVDFQIGDNLRAIFQAGLVSSTRTYPLDNSTAGGIGVNGFLGSPVGAFGDDPALGSGRGICARDALLGVPDGTTGFCTHREGNFGQSFGRVMHGDRGESLYRAIYSATAEWLPIPSMSNRLVIGSDRVERDTRTRLPLDPLFNLEGSNSYARHTTETFSMEYTGTLEGSMGDVWRRWTTFGAQYFSTLHTTLSCSGSEYANNIPTSCGAAFNTSGNNSLSEQKEVGAFLHQRLGYRGYLFSTAALRFDDNASLGQDYGAIWSPSANVSAVISEMPFWDVDAISELRLRAAWGTASQSPAPYSADATFSSSAVVVGGVTTGGVLPANPGNPDLGPERSSEVEVGLDAGFFDGRVGLTFTYFQTRVRDLIVSRPVAPSAGFAQSQLVNLGRMDSKGLEFMVDWNLVERPNFGWDVTVTHGTYDPVITDLGLDAPIFFPEGADGGSRAAGSQVFQTGFAPGAYVSRVVVNAVRDADGNIVSYDLAPGNLGDGSDLRVVGSPWPSAEQSLFTSVSLFRNWQISAMFDRVAGLDLLNVTRAFRAPFSDAGLGTGAYSREYAFRQAESTPDQQAMIERQDMAAFIEKGDYIKFREINVRYAFPTEFAQRMRASSMRLTLAGRNLKTWTDFSILDPEMDVQGSRDNFIRNNFAGSFPPMRMWWVGLNLTF